MFFEKKLLINFRDAKLYLHCFESFETLITFQYDRDAQCIQIIIVLEQHQGVDE